MSDQAVEANWIDDLIARVDTRMLMQGSDAEAAILHFAYFAVCSIGFRRMSAIRDRWPEVQWRRLRSLSGPCMVVTGRAADRRTP